MGRMIRNWFDSGFYLEEGKGSVNYIYSSVSCRILSLFVYFSPSFFELFPFIHSFIYSNFLSFFVPFFSSSVHLLVLELFSFSFMRFSIIYFVAHHNQDITYAVSSTPTWIFHDTKGSSSPSESPAWSCTLKSVHIDMFASIKLSFK